MCHPPAAPLRETKPGLVILVRSLEQLRVLVDLSAEGSPIRSVVADLELPWELSEAVAIHRGCWPEGVWLAGARITRQSECRSLEPLIRERANDFLVRNAE